MILEGVSSSRMEFQEYIGVSIFVDTPKDICLKRGVERDSCTGTPEEELNRMWKGWFEEEDRYMERDQPKQRSDIEIDGTRPFEDQISAY
jgi:uridine kinase